MHQHGDGHGANPSRVRSDAAGDRLNRGKIDIADQARAALRRRIRNAVNAHVNDGGAGPDHIGFKEFGHTHSGDNDVGSQTMGLDVAGSRVTERDGGVGEPVFLTEEPDHGE